MNEPTNVTPFAPSFLSADELKANLIWGSAGGTREITWLFHPRREDRDGSRERQGHGQGRHRQMEAARGHLRSCLCVPAGLP